MKISKARQAKLLTQVAFVVDAVLGTSQRRATCKTVYRLAKTDPANKKLFSSVNDVSHALNRAYGGKERKLDRDKVRQEFGDESGAGIRYTYCALSAAPIDDKKQARRDRTGGIVPARHEPRTFDAEGQLEIENPRRSLIPRGAPQPIPPELGGPAVVSSGDETITVTVTGKLAGRRVIIE